MFESIHQHDLNLHNAERKQSQLLLSKYKS